MARFTSIAKNDMAGIPTARHRSRFRNAMEMSGPGAGILAPSREFEMITVQRRGFVTREIGERLVVVNDGA